MRIVNAADEERRRIERDIHDGAQQRLVALALQLRSAQRRLPEESDPEVDRLLAVAVSELQVAVEELRELARGVHPAILTEDGLAAALDSLVSRSPFPIELDADEGRLPAPVEGDRVLRRVRGTRERRQARGRVERGRSPLTSMTACSWLRSRTTASAERARTTAPF